MSVKLTAVSVFLFVLAWPVAGEVTTASDCLGDVRAFSDQLKRSNDPQLRVTLAGCVTQLRDDYFEAKARAAELEASAAKLDKRSPKEAASLRSTAAEVTTEDVPAIEAAIKRVEQLLLADAKLLTTRIADLAKAETELTLDDATADQLELARRALRKLLPLIVVADGKVTLREDDYVRLANKANAEIEKMALEEARRRAEAECRTTYAHLEKVREAAQLTECIDLLSKLLREGSNKQVEYEEKVKKAKAAVALRQSLAKESARAVVRVKNTADGALAAAAKAAAEEAEQEAARKEAAEAKAAAEKAAEAEKAAKLRELAEKERKLAREKAEAELAATRARLAEVERQEAQAIADAAAEAEAEAAALAEKFRDDIKISPELSVFNVASRRWTGELARFEEAGRRLTKERMKKVEELEERRKKADSDAAKAALDTQIKAAKADLDALDDRVIVPDGEPVKEFADFEQWYNKFSLGYEYQSITDAFSKGFPRVGFTVGFHYPRLKLPENSENFSLGRFGFYNSFTLALTNSGELEPTPLADTFAPPKKTSGRYVGLAEEDPAPETPPAAPPSGPKRAIELEASIFMPVWRNDYQVLNPRLRTRIGPYLSIGGRKIDDDTFVHHRVYLGLRTARSPETFADFLYGKSGNLRSKRLEVRGQLAVPHVFANGSYFVVGGIGNFGLSRSRHGGCEEAAPSCHPLERDSIRFYISYDIQSSGLFGFFGGEAKQ